MMLNDDNVIPLWPRWDCGDWDCGDVELPVSVEDLGEAVDAIGRCLSQTAVEPKPGCGFDGISVASFLLYMGVVEQKLEGLAAITVATWPDVRWALRFSNARVRALTTIRDSAASLSSVRSYNQPSHSLAGSAPLGRALREVHDLIVQRYPQTFQVC